MARRRRKSFFVPRAGRRIACLRAMSGACQKDPLETAEPATRTGSPFVFTIRSVKSAAPEFVGSFVASPGRSRFLKSRCSCRQVEKKRCLPPSLFLNQAGKQRENGHIQRVSGEAKRIPPPSPVHRRCTGCTAPAGSFVAQVACDAPAAARHTRLPRGSLVLRFFREAAVGSRCDHDEPGSVTQPLYVVGQIVGSPENDHGRSTGLDHLPDDVILAFLNRLSRNPPQSSVRLHRVRQFERLIGVRPDGPATAQQTP